MRGRTNEHLRGEPPSNGLLGMCRWIGWHFNDWTDYNVVTFSAIFNRVTWMGSHFFGTLRVSKSFAKKWLKTPLCNRPSGIFFLSGFSGKNSLVWTIPHWDGLFSTWFLVLICVFCIWGDFFSVIRFPESGCLTVAQLKGGKKSGVSRGVARIFSRGRDSFWNPPPLPSLLKSGSYCFIFSSSSAWQHYVVCFRLVGTNLNRCMALKVA